SVRPWRCSSSAYPRNEHWPSRCATTSCKCCRSASWGSSSPATQGSAGLPARRLAEHSARGMRSPASIVFLAVLLLLLISIVIYARSGPRPDADQRAKGGQLLGGAGTFLLGWFMWLITALVEGCLRVGLGADFYHYLGL